MSAYYNEFDPFAAAWLRELIKADLIAPGDVDERSITEVTASDVAGYTQCHFFAGIGGWSYALRLAGWPDARPIWTGSCPCQPFSQSGLGNGTSDSRHLWPALFKLIAECKPPIVTGEQVAGPDGSAWIDLVFTNMEAAGYGVWAANLCAAGIGAPHIRQRLYWLGDSIHRERWAPSGVFARTGTSQLPEVTPDGSASCETWASEWIECEDGRRPIEPGTFPLAHGIPNRVGLWKGYGNAIVPQVAAEVIMAYMDCQL